MTDFNRLVSERTGMWLCNDSPSEPSTCIYDDNPNATEGVDCLKTKATCGKYIPYDFLHSWEAFGMLVEWLHNNYFDVIIHGTELLLYRTGSRARIRLTSVKPDGDDIREALVNAFLEATKEQP